MPIVDAQVHAYEANTPQRPWHTIPKNWPAHVTGDEMVAAMDKVGVDGAIFVSPFIMYQYDEPFRLTNRLSDSERAMLMGGACTKAYGWSPKKG